MIDGSRRKRIAAGSGSTVQQVNQLLEARKQMEKVMKQMKSGKMPSLAELQGGDGPSARRSSATKKSKSKRKKKARSRR
jgi:signal recognition particle subunit SRP54